MLNVFVLPGKLILLLVVKWECELEEKFETIVSNSTRAEREE